MPTDILPAPNTTAVRVFMSYSWDSEEHKKWVLEFATRLRADGVDAIVDQLHLELGARSPEFMERAIKESDRVLVICTEKYKMRFDNRDGGVGYEGHIITGEIVSKVGKNKFVPILRNGSWENAIPTALSGVIGVDLRQESTEEYRKLIANLHRVSSIPAVGPRPAWLNNTPESVTNVGAAAVAGPDPSEYWEQRKRLPDTELMKKIWSKPRWRIWIRPMEFKKARFQSVEQCKAFMISSYVLVRGWFPYPWFSVDALELGEEWVGGEIEHVDNGTSRLERWALFRSGQFVHNRALDEIPLLGTRIHVLEILDTVTAAFELAARMAEQGVLSPDAALTFEMNGVDGRELIWQQNIFGDGDVVGPNCWCQDEHLSVIRRVASNDLKERRRELALEVALEIFSRFGWSNPPKQRLIDEQQKRIA